MVWIAASAGFSPALTSPAMRSPFSFMGRSLDNISSSPWKRNRIHIRRKTSYCVVRLRRDSNNLDFFKLKSRNQTTILPNAKQVIKTFQNWCESLIIHFWRFWGQQTSPRSTHRRWTRQQMPWSRSAALSSLWCPRKKPRSVRGRGKTVGIESKGVINYNHLSLLMITVKSD